MDRRTFLGTLAGGLLAAPLAVEAQQAGKIYRIGLIATETPSQPPGSGPLWDRMRALGWVYGQNVVVERRASLGQNERVPDLAADLIKARVDVFLVVSADAAEHVQRITRTIPIVTFAAGDLIAAGLAASLSRPGGNITGVQLFQVDLAAKQLALLKELLPRLSRVGLFFHWYSSEATLRSGRSIYAGMIRELEAAAPRLGIDIHLAMVHGPVDFEAAFSSLSRAGAGAVIVFGSELIGIHRRGLVALSAKYHLPAIYQAGAYVTEGGLMSYGPDFREHARLVADTLDKVLRGVRAGDIPIQQPTTFELVINLTTAKALGLTIPPSLLQRADQVIE